MLIKKIKFLMDQTFLIFSSMYRISVSVNNIAQVIWKYDSVQYAWDNEMFGKKQSLIEKKRKYFFGGFSEVLMIKN